MDKIDDCAMVAGLDFMVALVLVLAAVMLAILIMPSLSNEDKSWRIKQYMVATRATDNLVQDTGEPGWEGKWRSNVTKIGLVYDDEGIAITKVLNLTKVRTFMGYGYTDETTEITWWEFPNSSISPNERENAARSLGLGGYNFYMQLHPVGFDNFNSTPLVINLTDRSKVPINDDTVSVVDRYVFIEKDSTSSCRSDFICYGNPNVTVHYRLNLWVW